MQLLSGIDVIYWINLDRAKGRKQYMEKLFKNSIFDNIKKVRVKALDAKKENPRNKFIIEQDMNLLNDNKNRSDAEYACLYSHLKAIKEFSKIDYDVALICEDDLSIEYKKYWTKTIQEVMENAPKQWEILKICSFFQFKDTYTFWESFLRTNENIFEKKQKWLEHMPSVKGDWGAVSYLIKNSAAKKLMRIMAEPHDKYKLNNTLMHVSDAYLFQMLKTFIYKYPFFTFLTSKLSYIQNKTVTKSNITLKNKITKMYKTRRSGRIKK